MKFGRFSYALGVVLLGLAFTTTTYAAPVLGYVGPGAGLSMLGALFAVLCVIVLALLGPILYPIRMYLCWRRRRLEAEKLAIRDPGALSSSGAMRVIHS